MNGVQAWSCLGLVLWLQQKQQKFKSGLAVTWLVWPSEVRSLAYQRISGSKGLLSCCFKKSSEPQLWTHDAQKFLISVLEREFSSLWKKAGRKWNVVSSLPAMSELNEKDISAVAVGEAFRQVIMHMKVSFVPVQYRRSGWRADLWSRYEVVYVFVCGRARKGVR